jgi:hypothetical protein
VALPLAVFQLAFAGRVREKWSAMSEPTGAVGKTGKPTRPAIMRWFEFACAAFVLLVMLLMTGLVQELSTRILTRYPDSWATIRPGMTSSEARAILGAPTSDGRHLKSLDRWIITQRGVTMHLDLWFDDAGEHKEVSRVSRHKRYWGYNTEKCLILPSNATIR